MESSYKNSGLNAQRRYPNEELLRFMGRNFFHFPVEQRKNIKILELGCGSCANLWMIAHEGFSAYGIDLSKEAICLGECFLKNWDCEADLKVASMLSLPYGDAQFDAIIDVFSSYCMDISDFEKCLQEVKRVLKPEGLFFSYIPGKASDAFLNHKPSILLDSSTLNGIYRKDSPFAGNHYPLRFIHPEEYRRFIHDAGMEINYLEAIESTYNQRQETFEHVVLEAFNKV